MCETLEMFFISYWTASMNSTWLGMIWLLMQAESVMEWGGRGASVLWVYDDCRPNAVHK